MNLPENQTKNLLISPSPSPTGNFYFGGSYSSEDVHSGDLSDLSEFSEFSEDSTFERVSINDEYSEGEILFGSNSEDGNSIDENISNELPFWFSNEDADHTEVIMNKYKEKLISNDEFQRSHQPFIASITRSKVDFNCNPFQTFDTIEICNNQRVSPHSNIPCIRTAYLLCSWDTDGIPISFFTPPADSISSWISRTENQPHSYLYCFPDWYQENDDGPATKFVFSSSTEYKPVTYANLPWEKTPYHNCISVLSQKNHFQQSISPTSSFLFLNNNNKFSP